MAAENLIFLDEGGVTTEMTRRRGRIQGGARLPDAAPGGHWRTLTVLGAVSTAGWVATMTIEAPTGPVSATAPASHRGDGQSARPQGGRGAGAHRTTGARLLYLPPYSPDFNQIEKCWSQLKQHLRGAKARSVAALEQATAKALCVLTPHQAKAFVRLARYGL